MIQPLLKYDNHWWVLVRIEGDKAFLQRNGETRKINTSNIEKGKIFYNMFDE